MMLRDALVGAWTLVSSLPDGPLTYPHCPDALGLIMYTPDGYMSAQIMTSYVCTARSFSWPNEHR